MSACAIGNVLLILVGISQMIIIVLMLKLLKAIDKPDLSKEDASVKDATIAIRDATQNLPPRT